MKCWLLAYRANPSPHTGEMHAYIDLEQKKVITMAASTAGKLLSLFDNALILYLTSRKMQCSYFSPLSVYHFMGIVAPHRVTVCVCEQP